MSETPLLPYYPEKTKTSTPDLDSYLAGYRRSLRSSSDVNSYLELQKILDSGWLGQREPRSRSNDWLYPSILNTYNIYGSGYFDSLKRYRSEPTGLRKRYHRERDEEEERASSARYSRVTFGYFSAFVVMVTMALVIVVRGVITSSAVTIEVAVVTLGVSMCAGLAWLGRAEIERRRFRDI